MHAITLKQPWAYAICHLGKRIENRTRKPPMALVGQRIAIHAGAAIDRGAASRMHPHNVHMPISRELLPESCVVATARLDGWVRTDAMGPLYMGIGPTEAEDALASRWFFGPIGHVLAAVRVLSEPVPCRGQLGYWRLPADVEAAVHEGSGKGFV